MNQSFTLAILSFNHPHITSQLLNSIDECFAGKQVSKLLCHNGSLDEHVGFLQENYPHWTHLILDSNKGYSGGANEVLRWSFCQQGFDWVYFFTNDTALLSFPQNLPQQVGMYAPILFRRNRQKIDSIGGVYQWRKNKLFHCKSAGDFHHASVGCYRYIPGTAFLMHKQVYQQTGGFDESFHTYWEDVDLSLRYQLAKGYLGIECDWQLIHKVGKTCHKDPFYTKYLFHKNAKEIRKRYWNLPWKALLSKLL